jgi:homoserine kinase type II
VAVYTEVADEELSAFIATYDIGTVLSFKGIAEGVENSNYFLHTSAGSYIVTLYEKRVREADLPFFLGLMEHLARRGLTCPQPVRNRRGEPLGRLAGRPAAIINFLEGLSIRRPTARHCHAVGEALAQFHLAGRDFPMQRPNALSVSGWPPLFETAERDADRVAPGLAERTRRELQDLCASWPAGLPTGVIHADLFTDNVFFIGDAVSGLIDFYFACTDAFAYDLAICLNAWCFEPDVSFNVTKGRAMIAGYQKVRRLDEAEVAALPVLCRGSALRFMLTRLVDWLNVPAGALVRPKDPLEYDRKLAFHRRVTSAADYGLEA